MPNTNRMKSASFLVLAIAALVGTGVGLWLLSSTNEREAGVRPAFERNLEFFKRGREDFAICVSDYTATAESSSGLTSRVRAAVGKNKAGFWQDTFLEAEPIVVDSPCPKGPTFDENTRNLMEHLGSIPIVEEPGPYILYVHVLSEPHFALIDDLKLGGRIMEQELADFSPNQVAGYEQVAAALYLTRAEFEDPVFLARQVAEALGCTEGCAGPAR